MNKLKVNTIHKKMTQVQLSSGQKRPTNDTQKAEWTCERHKEEGTRGEDKRQKDRLTDWQGPAFRHRTEI